MDLNIYSVKNVVNRLLEYVLHKLYISIVLATSFFVIICEMNTFRSFGLQFELLMSYVLCFMSYVLCFMSYVLCLQIKSASDSEAQKANTARGVKKSEETGVCCKLNSTDPKVSRQTHIECMNTLHTTDSSDFLVETKVCECVLSVSLWI